MILRGTIRSVSDIISSFFFVIWLISRETQCRRNIPKCNVSKNNQEYLFDRYHIHPTTEQRGLVVTKSVSSRTGSASDTGYPLGYSGVPREELSVRSKQSTVIPSSRTSADHSQQLFFGSSDTEIDVESNQFAFGAEDEYSRTRPRGYNEPHRDKGAARIPTRRGIVKDKATNDDSNFERSLDLLRRQSITPVVYRFFARSQAAKAVATSITAGSSIPFILLVPNVEHWKRTAHELASRGYNVIAVGPKQDDPDDDEDEIDSKENEEGNDTISKRYLQGPALVLQLMDALRWTKVILVGCDNEAMMAIQAALSLSSSSLVDAKSPTSFFTGSDTRRSVVGLILCGKLEETESLIFSSTSDLSVSRFLEHNVLCPFTIVWDGDEESLKLSGMPAATIINDRTDQYRTMIIGGGSAPHRKRPEYFAWVLSRFVEEKIAPSINTKMEELRARNYPQRRRTFRRSTPLGDSNHDNNDQRRLPHISLPVPWKVPTEMLNEESFVVFGRVAATALFYGMMFKVLLYQYQNLRFGIDMITLFRQTTLGTFRRAVLRTGSILFFRSTTAVETEPMTQDSNEIVNSNIKIDDRNSNAELLQQKNVTNDLPSQLDLTEAKDQKRIQPFEKVKSIFSRFRNKTQAFRKDKASLVDDPVSMNGQHKSMIGLNSTEPSISQESPSSETTPERNSNDAIIDDLYDDDIPHLQNNSTEKRRFNPIFLLDHVIT